MSIKRSTFLGDILVEDGIISRNQLNIALKIREPAEISGRGMVKLGVISPCELYIALEALLAEILLDLGFADEREIFDLYPAIENQEAYSEPAYIL